MMSACFVPTPLWERVLSDPINSRALLAVVERAEQIIGWCRLFPLHDLPWGERDLLDVELGIGLLAAYHHRGIGTKLMQFSLDWAATTGVKHIWLTADKNNGPALALFERFGFSTDQTSANSMRMVLELDDPKRGN